MSNYGYGRVSSKDQHLERQLEAFQTCGITFKKIFCDKKSGKDFERASYKKMLKILKSGDLLVVKSLDRLGRNYDAILEEWRRITKEIGADILVLDMPLLDTRSKNNLIGKFVSDLVLQLLSFVAEMERENIRTRQAEGIRIAKERGVRFGRPKVPLPEDFEEVISRYLDRSLTCAEAMQMLDMRPSTFYRYAKQFRPRE